MGAGGCVVGWSVQAAVVTEKTKDSICRFSLAVRRTLLHTPPHLDRDSAATSDL